MKCPCENCLCISMCRNRLFIQILKTCKLMKDFVLYNKDDEASIKHRERFLRFREILKPTKWYISGNYRKTGGFTVTPIPEGENPSDPKYNRFIAKVEVDDNYEYTV